MMHLFFPLPVTSKRPSVLLAILCLVWPMVSSSSEEVYPEFVEEIYLTPEKALLSVFPKETIVLSEERSFQPEEKDRIEKRLRWKLPEESITIYKGEKAGKNEGWAVISEEIGKFKPMTFIVKVSPKGAVERVDVMVYREPVGREIKRQRFLRQFRKKTVHSPIRMNRDIINITGATLSVRGITAGIRKVLVILDELGYTAAEKKDGG